MWNNLRDKGPTRALRNRRFAEATFADWRSASNKDLPERRRVVTLNQGLPLNDVAIHAGHHVSSVLILMTLGGAKARRARSYRENTNLACSSKRSTNARPWSIESESPKDPVQVLAHSQISFRSPARAWPLRSFFPVLGIRNLHRWNPGRCALGGVQTGFSGSLLGR